MATTMRGRQAIRDFTEHEHRELTPAVNRIHAIACDAHGAPTTDLSLGVLEVLRWFDSVLQPHMAWEEHWLFPQIEARAGTPWVTRSIRFDHQQLNGLAGQLRRDHALLQARPMRSEVDETRCHLYALEALVHAHVEREERFLLPLLDGTAGDEP
jgi:iron-sulfur cluster repair protein YtfE (RIC family)